MALHPHGPIVFDLGASRGAQGLHVRYVVGLDRDRLADVLRSLFFHENDPDSGRFLYQVELERDTLVI